jgi:hypothetical protein
MPRKAAILVLYSIMLLAAGYFAGRSAATTAAPAELPSAASAIPLDANAADSEPTLTDWPGLTPD